MHVPLSENPDQIGTNSDGPIDRPYRDQDDQSWAGFTTVLNVRVVESNDDPEEQFYIYTEGEVEREDLNELMRAARVVDRLYLQEIPFLIIYSDADVETVHIGWGIQMTHIDDWLTVLKEKTKEYMLASRLADEVLGENIDSESDFYNLSHLDLQKLHETTNLHIFFLS